ncbi:MAG TPA: glycosyltransferase family 39 protein [Blastocatellia bacterium]|nr:glycosyltransferase family 39 protein [Blastocatellia bacterium]
MPGYPLFIAASRLIIGHNNFGIVLIQTALFLASVWFVYKVAIRAFDELTGFVFLVFSAIYPFVAYSVGQLSPETPVVFLVSLAFFLLSDPTTPRVALAALVIGLSAYVRPNLILLNIALAAALVLINRNNYRKALLMVVIAITIAFPWALRNYRLFGIFTPTPAIKGSGNSLLLATWQSRVSIPSLIEYGMNGNVTSEARSSGMADQISGLNRQLGVPESALFVTPESYPGNRLKLKADALFAEAAFANIKNYPIEYLKSCFINTFRMWFSAYFPGSFPVAIRYGLLAEGILVLIIGLGGAFISMRGYDERQKTVLILFIMTFLYFALTLCWLHTEARYTIPARLPLLLFAARFVSHSQGRRA